MEDDIQAQILNAAEHEDISTLKILLDSTLKEVVRDLINNPVSAKTLLTFPCQHGHLSMVKYLIEEWGADVEQFGIAVFNGKRIEGLTPLWCAAAGGHLDIVKKLVSYNAQVNATTKTKSTPLFGACKYGHYEIVKYLCENGANVNKVNRKGNTCLIRACIYGDLNIVKHLIQYGADLNVENNMGMGALFTAVGSGNCELVKMLLDHGAKTEIRFNNMTPLLFAAHKRNVPVVEFFIKKFPCKQTEKIYAYELLGASFVDADDLLQGYDYWKKAMEMRHENVDFPILKPLNMLPIIAYNNATEVNTCDELELIRESHDDMYMQALLIRERILGRNNEITLDYIEYRASCYFQTFSWERCIQLCIYGISIEQEALKILNHNVIHVLYHIVRVLHEEMYEDGSIVKDMPNICFSNLLTLLRQASKEIINGLQHATINENEFRELLIITLYFIGFLYDMPNLSIEDELQVEKEITALIHLNPKSSHGWTFLHIACSNYSFVIDYKCCPFPCRKVVQLLLKYGASPNARNDYGDTPLHIAAKCMPIDKSIFRLLLENGAHIDFRNKDKKTVLDLLNPADVDIFPLQYLNLKCFCANVIHKAKIPYCGKVPKVMEEFVDTH